jgi:hypothetical protein
MGELKPGDVVAIKKAGRWWGEVVLPPSQWCASYMVVVGLSGNDGWLATTATYTYKREDLEPVGVNVRD